MTISTGLFIFLFILELLGMVFFYLFMRSRFSRARLLADVRAEVDKLIVDLGREADRDVALLESRILNLRSLMDEADRRILLAGTETARRRDAAETAAALASGRQGDSIGISAAAARTARDGIGLSAAARTARDGVPVFPSSPGPVLSPESVSVSPPEPVPVPESVPAREESARPAQPDIARASPSRSEPITVYTRPAFKRSETPIEPVIPLQERVLDMARKNISNDLIASTMSISLGEVELIIAMNNSSL